MWDVDREIAALEPPTVPGTILCRVQLDLALMAREGLQPTPAQHARGGGVVWCLSLGRLLEPGRAFFYGQTIRDAVARALGSVRTS